MGEPGSGDAEEERCLVLPLVEPMPDSCDNCPFTDNWTQLDAEGDGYGNAGDICPGGHDGAASARSWPRGDA